MKKSKVGAGSEHRVHDTNAMLRRPYAAHPRPAIMDSHRQQHRFPAGFPPLTPFSLVFAGFCPHSGTTTNDPRGVEGLLGRLHPTQHPTSLPPSWYVTNTARVPTYVGRRSRFFINTRVTRSPGRRRTHDHAAHHSEAAPCSRWATSVSIVPVSKPTTASQPEP